VNDTTAIRAQVAAVLAAVDGLMVPAGQHVSAAIHRLDDAAEALRAALLELAK
jgi:hypothetical protein